MPACLRTSSSRGDQRRVAGHEGGAVAGEVGLLGQRVDGEQALVRCPRRRAGRGCSGPSRAPRPRASRARRSTRRWPRPRRAARAQATTLAQVLDAAAPGRSGCRGVEPQQLRRATGGQRAQRREAVGTAAGSRRRCARRRRTSGRRPRGWTTTSPAPSPSRVGSQATSSLRPIVGSTPSGSTPGHPATAGEPGGDRLAQRRACRRSAGSRGRRRPSASASWTTSGVGSTGVPTERSTMPSGCANAPAP